MLVRSLFVVAFAVGCQATAPDAPFSAANDGSFVGGDSLYTRLGEEPGVNVLVERIVKNVGNDASLNWMFEDRDLAAVEVLLRDYVCAATGGPCTYTGRDMKTAHAGLAITDAQFDAFITDVLLALDSGGVSYTPDYQSELAGDQLMALLVGTRGDIVEDPAGDQVLFNRIGGYAAVAAVVPEFLRVVTEDARINWFFSAENARNTRLDFLEDRLVMYVCAATGGACIYDGAEMDTLHAGMAITDTQFNALAEDLATACNNLGVPTDAGTPGGDLLAAVGGLHDSIVTDPDGTAILFNRLGGRDGVAAVVPRFLERVAADARVNFFFAGADLGALGGALETTICQATGGWCGYAASGEDLAEAMSTVHAGMAITDAQFDAVAEDLAGAMTDLGVNAADTDATLAVVASLRSAIVTDAAGDAVLFNRLGGLEGVNAAVAKILEVVGADARINGRFATTDLAALQVLLVEYTCVETGGYCTYTGRDMATAHTGMEITQEDFDAFIEDIGLALDALGVPHAVEGDVGYDLIDELDGAKTDIIGR
jgi:hemoglobin